MGLLTELRENRGFRLGDPWRLTEEHVAVVVPIIRLGEVGERGYVLVEEVKEKIKVIDGGSIGSIRMFGAVRPVLVRSGVVIEGIKTQSRSVEFSTIIMPGAEAQITVRCVHASHPISQGADMRVLEMCVPPEVHSALLSGSVRSGNQHAVWEAVRTYHSRTSDLIRHGTPTASVRAESDNLIRTHREVHGFRRDVDHILTKMPINIQGQVGVVVLGIKGVLGLEMFDHPQSWLAASKAVGRRYADLLTMEGESTLFELKIDAVRANVMSFLEKTIRAQEKTVHENLRTRTTAFQNENIVGERIELDNIEVYVVATLHHRTTEPGTY